MRKNLISIMLSTGMILTGCNYLQNAQIPNMQKTELMPSVNSFYSEKSYAENPSKDCLQNSNSVDFYNSKNAKQVQIKRADELDE